MSYLDHNIVTMGFICRAVITINHIVRNTWNLYVRHIAVRICLSAAYVKPSLFPLNCFLQCGSNAK